MTTWTKRQQKAHRKAWIKALRSGNYKQGRSHLHQGDNYCCLGVACELSGLGNWTVSAWGEGVLDYFGDHGMMPEPVMEWLGLRGKLGSYGPPDKKLYLADHNDNGKTFAEIADIIESEPPGLLA